MKRFVVVGIGAVTLTAVTVLGYSVTSAASPSRHQLLSATNNSTGSYTVVTDRDISACSVVATISGGNYYVSAFVSGDDVFASTWSLSGGVVTPTNLSWIFTVTC